EKMSIVRTPVELEDKRHLLRGELVPAESGDEIVDVRDQSVPELDRAMRMCENVLACIPVHEPLELDKEIGRRVPVEHEEMRGGLPVLRPAGRVPGERQYLGAERLGEGNAPEQQASHGGIFRVLHARRGLVILEDELLPHTISPVDEGGAEGLVHGSSREDPPDDRWREHEPSNDVPIEHGSVLCDDGMNLLGTELEEVHDRFGVAG